MTNAPPPESGAPLPLWGKRGRPPRSAAGTYSRRNDVVLEQSTSPRGGQKSTANRGGISQPIRDPAAKAAARAMYEATPGGTCLGVAEESGIPVGTIRRWKAEGGWISSARTIPNLAGRAGQLANTFKTKMSEIGRPLSDEQHADEQARELSETHAVSIRAAVLDRHRKEWSAPRKIAYDAIKKANANDIAGAHEMAKLAKLTAETLQIVQVGECRSYGLDHASRGADGGTVVVIDRTPNPAAPGALPAVADHELHDGGPARIGEDEF